MDIKYKCSTFVQIKLSNLQKMTIEETRNKLDILFSEVKAYRQSDRFRALLDFCANFRTLAPYNAMLVQLQMPLARFVLTPREWRKYNRTIKANARPLVILLPFGPVDFVFEIQDTYTPELNSSQSYSDEYIIKEVERPFRVYGQSDPKILQDLIYAMQYHGVAYDPHLKAGVDYGADISSLEGNDEPHDVTVHINKNIGDLRTKAKFLVRTNEQLKNEEQLASIVHELGHLFCYHIPCPGEWKDAWKIRKLDKSIKEFEAEAVAKIVCDKLGIKTTSDSNLSSYLDGYKELPISISVENICTAATKILAMCIPKKRITYRDGMLYKYDIYFQTRVKKELALRKRK